MKIRIAVDVDGVLRELVWSLYILLHNNKDIPFEFDRVPSMWKDWHIHNYVVTKDKNRTKVDPQDFYNLWFNSKYTEKLYTSAEPYWRSRKEFDKLVDKGFDVTILSAQPNSITMRATTEWLDKLGFLGKANGLIYTSNKSLYSDKFDIFIEDSPIQAAKIKATNPNAKIAMIRRSYNLGVISQYDMFRSFFEAVEVITKRKTL